MAGVGILTEGPVWSWAEGKRPATRFADAVNAMGLNPQIRSPLRVRKLLGSLP